MERAYSQYSRWVQSRNEKANNYEEMDPKIISNLLSQGLFQWRKKKINSKEGITPDKSIIKGVGCGPTRRRDCDWVLQRIQRWQMEILPRIEASLPFPGSFNNDHPSWFLWRNSNIKNAFLPGDRVKRALQEENHAKFQC